ncbi:MAG: hypothetical protein ABIH23_29435 [bacterium]
MIPSTGYVTKWYIYAENTRLSGDGENGDGSPGALIDDSFLHKTLLYEELEMAVDCMP